MLNFGAAKAIDFLPDEEARAWVATELRMLVSKLGQHASESSWIAAPPKPIPRDLDGLFELMCGVQSRIGQSDVEFALLEQPPDAPPELPSGFVPLGDPSGHLMHTFAREEELVVIVAPAAFRLGTLTLASVARELGRIGLFRARVEPTDEVDREASAELAAIALGLGVWIANGSYVFDNACCGGGCGIDLGSIRAGLSMPEACFALALDGHRRGFYRRTVIRYLGATQSAAAKRSWGFVGRQPELQRELRSAWQKPALAGT